MMRGLLPRLKLLAGVAVLALSACATTPPTSVHQPVSVRPPILPASAETSGAIYQTAYYAQTGSRYMPLFEDRRARNVGDTLIISINEKTSASKKSNSNANRTGSAGFSVPSIFGLPGKSFQGADLSANSSTSFDGKGESASNNDFTGIITVTVTEVLPNGNLVIEGVREVDVNGDRQVVVLTGVVRAVDVAPNNSISSTLVGQLRIRSIGRGLIKDSLSPGWLMRILNKIF